MIEIETPLGIIDVPEHEAHFIDFKGYRGNALLKRAGVKVEWTVDLIREFKRCKKDPIYFIETYVKVVHVDYGLIPFKLRPYQIQLIENIHNNRRCITTMARQSGKSTAVVAYLLWYILFNAHKTVLLLANKADTAREILGKAQMAYLHLPSFLQQGIVDGGWNKGSMMLENGSRAIASSSDDASVRGYTASMLILDETAHIDHWEAFSKSTMPTVSSGRTTKIVMISTPNGMNHFYSYWERAKLKDVPKEDLVGGMKWNGYVPLLVTWREVPDRDESWYEETMQELNFDIEKFQQEYECEFMGSSGTLISGSKLKELAAKLPLHRTDNLYKYEEVVEKHVYAITADVSEGKMLDYSTFHVTDVTEMPYRQCATFRSNEVAPADFAEIIFRTAKAYNNAIVLIEYENLGPEVAMVLFDTFEYDNIICTESAGRVGKRVTMKSGKGIDKGIKMSVATKLTGCSLLKLLVEQNQYIVNDYHTIQELTTFVRKNNSWTAEEGKHDDLVMALVVFAWLSNQPYFKDLTNVDTINKLRELKSEQIEEDMLPFGFSSRDEVGYMPKTADLHRDLWGPPKTLEYTPYRFNDDEIEIWPNF